MGQIQSSINQAIGIASLLGTQTAGYKRRQEVKQLKQDIATNTQQMDRLAGTSESFTSSDYNNRYELLRRGKSLGLPISNLDIGTASWRAIELKQEEADANSEWQEHLKLEQDKLRAKRERSKFAKNFNATFIKNFEEEKQ